MSKSPGPFDPKTVKRKLTRRRLVGIDRSGPEPTATRAGQPLRPFTIPNVVGYVRIALLPLFLVLAFGSGDGRSVAAALIFWVIAAGDYFDGFLARATGQYSRLGALMDPVIDRATVLAGVAVAWNFELLPRWGLVLLAARELATLGLARYGLKHGVDIEINWIGRVGVFWIFTGLFLSFIFEGPFVEIAFFFGLACGIVASWLYYRRARAVQGGSQPSTPD